MEFKMLIWPGESVYEGNWDSDMFDGYSRLAYQSGDIYEGEWHYDTAYLYIEMRKVK